MTDVPRAGTQGQTAVSIAYDDFLAGIADDREFTVVHARNPALTLSFLFSDDVWPLVDILPINEIESRAMINFGWYPEWLRTDGKHYIAARWLEQRVGLNAIWGDHQALRDLGRALPDFDRTARDLRRRHARPVKTYVTTLGLDDGGAARVGGINRFAKHVRHFYQCDEHDFHVSVPARPVHRRGRKPANENADEKVIPPDIRAKLLEACFAEERLEAEARTMHMRAEAIIQRYKHRVNGQRAAAEQGLSVMLAFGERYPVLLHRAIMAQAVKLSLLVGRRGVQVSDLPLDVRIEDRTIGGQRHLFLFFPENKVSGVFEPVPIAESDHDLALETLQKARELTALLRELLPHKDVLRERLFLVPGNSVLTPPAPLLRDAVNLYLNGVLVHESAHAKAAEAKRKNPEDRKKGGAPRRDVLKWKRRERTRPSKRQAGPTARSLLDAQKDALRREGVPDGMVWQNRGIFLRYNIRMPDGSIAEFTTHNFRHTNATLLHANGAPIQIVAQYLGQVGTTMAQLHYAVEGDARGRAKLDQELRTGALKSVVLELLPDAQVLEERIGTQQAELLRKRGVFLSPTRFGYCLQHKDSGACPTGNACWAGPKGKGCSYHVLSPDALEALQDALAIVEGHINYGSEKGYRMWVTHYEIMRERIVTMIGETMELKRRYESGEATCCGTLEPACSCGNNRAA